jgi:UDP-GlcNAc:undecaprenyl-phosphate GlcNAc-1-phosphate transferase
MAFRMQKGKSIFLGSKDHFALRLEAMGYKRKSIILIAYLISVILSMAAFIITIVKFNNAIMVYLAVGLLAFLFAVKLSFVKVE